MADERRRDRAIEHVLRRGVGGPVSSASGPCLDGEVLAAWSSGALERGEAARVEAHIADCVRCQSMLAVFVRTEPISAAPAPWWQRAQLRWLVPLATAATVAAIWVAIPEREMLVEHSDRVLRIEPEQRPALDQSPAPPDKPAAAPRDETAQSSVQRGAPQGESAREALEPADSLQRREKVDDTAAKQRSGAAPAAPPPAAPAVPPGAPSAKPPIAESVTVTGEAPLLMAGVAAVDIVSPGGTTRWRIEGGSQVQRSTTQGASWEAVTLPADRTLTSGHSPSPSVAWLVGKAGAIFVTTDGARFELVPFVSSADLVSIVAVDDRQATVTTVEGRVFRTVDRGRTWSTP